jgi:parallel beta-helix repeat protein
MLFNTVRSLFRAKAGTGPRRPRRAALPAVEALETRAVPATLYVGPPGTHVPNPAFHTIHDALDAAHPGDTIKVEPGTYAEQLTVTKDRIRLLALGDRDHDADDVTITAPDAGSGALVDVTGRNVTLSGFTLNGRDLSTMTIGVSIHDGGSATIVGNHITHFQGLGGAQFGFGVFADTHGRVEIVSNRIDHYNKGGILVKGGADADIEENVVVGAGPVGNIAQNGIQIGDFPADPGARYNQLQVAHAEVEENFVTGNVYTNSASDGFEAAGILVLNQAGGVEVEHNIVKANQDGIFLSDVSRLEIEHNEVRHNTADGILMVGDRVGDPRTGHTLTSGNEVEHNDASRNGRSGIDLFDSDRNELEHNVLVGNGQDGMTLSTSDHNEISHNRSADNAGDGIALFWSRSNEIEYNHSFRNGQDGIALLSQDGTLDTGSNDNEVEHNRSDCNDRDGIRVENSRGNALRYNTARGNGGEDINLVGSTPDTILRGNRTGSDPCDCDE